MARPSTHAGAPEVDYEPLPVVTDPEAALAADAPRLVAEGGNLARERRWPEPSRALEGAEVLVRARFVNQRVAAAPLEPNAAVAVPEPEGDGLLLYAPCQAPFWVRDTVAEVLGMDPGRVRVVVPAVGGAFGSRIATYPEQGAAGPAGRTALGVKADQVTVVHSDTAAVARGDGTMGSRSLQIGGSALAEAAAQVLDKATALAAHLLEAPAEDVARPADSPVGPVG
jgi:aerobic carbon-monoxide dehydrogenase large subunit